MAAPTKSAMVAEVLLLDNTATLAEVEAVLKKQGVAIRPHDYYGTRRRMANQGEIDVKLRRKAARRKPVEFVEEGHPEAELMLLRVENQKLKAVIATLL